MDIIFLFRINIFLLYTFDKWVYTTLIWVRLAYLTTRVRVKVRARAMYTRHISNEPIIWDCSGVTENDSTGPCCEVVKINKEGVMGHDGEE